jgi:hypothetical protein
MIYVKRLLASCAALALAATSMLPLTAAADSDGTITMTYGTEADTIKAGDTVKYFLKIKENDGVNGWSVLVEFDTDKLTYEKVTSKKIVEEVPGYEGVTTESKIVSPVPKSDQEGNSFPIVWAEGTKTYAEIFEENEMDVPAEVDGKNYVYTGINSGNPVAEIVFTANADISAEEIADLVKVSGTKATKNDSEDPAGKFEVEIVVEPDEVTPPPVEEVTVTLNATTGELKVGESKKLKATVTGTTDPVTWTSSNPEVATVAADGTVTGVAEGEATITAAVGDVSASCAVTVNPSEVPPVEPTVIKIPNVTLVEGKEKNFDLAAMLTAAGVTLPEGVDLATVVAALKVTIADPTVASYSADGTVVTFKGLAEGTTTVSVASPLPNYKFEDFTITVTPAGTPITEEIEIPAQTVTAGLSTIYDLSNTVPASVLENLEVESLDPAVATASLDGANLVINGLAAGTTKVQVKDKTTGTVLGSFDVTVEAAPETNEVTCDFAEKTIDLKLGGTKTLAIVVDPDDEDTATFKDMTKWKLVSSDSSIVSIDKEGHITGLKSGVVTITATRDDYDGTLKCTVTVKSVYPVYVPTSPVNPGYTVVPDVKDNKNSPERAKVTPYVNAIVDSESKAASVIAATGGEMDNETGNAPAIAAAALGLIALGFVVVARKKRHA